MIISELIPNSDPSPYKEYPKMVGGTNEFPIVANDAAEEAAYLASIGAKPEPEAPAEKDPPKDPPADDKKSKKDS